VNQHRRKTIQNSRNMPGSDYAIDEIDDGEVDEPKLGLTRRFSEHVAARQSDIDHLTDNLKIPNWATGNLLQSENLGRRHSFATVGSHQTAFHMATLEDTDEVDETLISPIHRQQSEQFDPSSYFSGHGPASRTINASAISAAHPDPHTVTNHSTQNPYTVPAVLGRAGRRLFVVTFKCSRADIYYLYDNTGLEIRRGDLVIVEGDRGCDLGQVAHADISLEDAKKFKKEASEEHFRWLVMFSQYSLAGSSNDKSMLGALARANGFPNVNRSSLTGMGGTLEIESKPKMIKRLAQKHEIEALRDKEGSEAKAKRLGAQKAAEHNLPMEILDAEYQADYHKLTYFYYAVSYVNFNDLVTDLFKQYKVRIWMSAVNPAGTHVPPPSAIGPGAITRSRYPNNSPLAIGPAFGSYRHNEQQGRTGANAAQYGGYEDAYHTFANQLPTYNQPQFMQSQQWSGAQQFAGNGQQYGARYGGYPVTGYPTASTASPMNYGAYYPPTTFSSSPAFNNTSSGASYRGGYPGTTSGPPGSFAPGTSTAGPAQYPSTAEYSTTAGQATNFGAGSSTIPTATTFYNPYASGGLSSYNSYTASTTLPPGATSVSPAGGRSNSPALVAAMQKASLGK